MKRPGCITEIFGAPASIIRFFAAEISRPLTATWEPIEELLDPAHDQDNLTRKWHESKLGELHFVGLTSALLASLFASAFGWQAAQQTGWSALASWYGGLMFVIASIASATQQSIMLRRLDSHPDYLRRLRNMLGHNRQPLVMQVFIWQIPVMMLRFGIYLFLNGLLIMLWSAARRDGRWHSEEGKTAVIFTVIAAFALCCHALSVFFTYSRARSDEEGP